jgi:hypothetical protein
MVYDEGFDFSFGNPNSPDYSTYFIFSKYDYNDQSNSKVKSKWSSYCYATLIGWFQQGDKYGCFYGHKKGHNKDEVTNGEALNKQVVVEGNMTAKTFLQLNEHVNNKNTPQIRFMESKFSEKLKLTADFKDHAKVVERINSENGSWKAANYAEFEGLSISDLNRLAGRKKSRTGNYLDFNFHQKESHSETESNESLFEYFNKNFAPKKKNNLKKSKELPEEFNWLQYMGKPKSQVKYNLNIGNMWFMFCRSYNYNARSKI